MLKAVAHFAYDPTSPAQDYYSREEKDYEVNPLGLVVRDGVEVLYPAELRKEFEEISSNMAQLYKA